MKKNIDEEKVRSIRQVIYREELKNKQSAKPKKEAEMVEVIKNTIKSEVGKCF